MKRSLIKVHGYFFWKAPLLSTDRPAVTSVAYLENICEGGGKLLHCEIYQQDIVLSENKVGLSTRVQGPYFPPRKTIVITRIRNTTSLIFKFGSKKR